MSQAATRAMTAQPTSLVRTSTSVNPAAASRSGSDAGSHWVVGVVLVVGLEFFAAEAVAGDDRGAGPQHTGDLGEKPVLQLDRRNVVQHRETRGAGESSSG